jgi:magnesium-transporting ATPase (P-type)
MVSRVRREIPWPFINSELLARMAQVRRVRRDGVEKAYSQLELVEGDIVCLAAGDIVPADCYIAKVSKHPCVIYR